MASSNRHWPSMFKSKPTHHQWQHDINPSLISNGCQKSTYSSGCEERSPEAKARWNPRPEQIRILEAIFNSGMVNPPRDEIRKIRAQLQEYGQVGDANVFYWFQNRKSRSKHKQQRHHLQNNKSLQTPPPPPMITSNFTPTTTASSSSSSDHKSSPNSTDKILSLGSTENILEASNINSPTTSVNQQPPPYFHQSQNDFLSVPFFFPVQQQQQEVPLIGAAYNTTQGFSFPEVSHVTDNSIETCSDFLLSDLLLMNHGSSKKAEDAEKMNLQPQLTYAAPPSPTTLSPTITSLSTINSPIQGETGGVGPTKSTVFINDVAFEVTMAPFNVRETFGEDAVLIHSSGQPVLTNDCGLTLHPLQHGSFYYFVHMLPPS